MSSNKSASALRRKRCPFCNELGSLDNDAVEAQIFCTECGMVVSMNLEESDDTRYYGEEGLSKTTDMTTMPSSQKESVGGSDNALKFGGSVRVIDRNNFARISEDIRYFLNNLTKMVQLTEEKVTIPSCYLYNDYIRLDNTRSQEGKYATAAACFSIVVARQYTPIPDHEITLHAPFCVRENDSKKEEGSGITGIYSTLPMSSNNNNNNIKNIGNSTATKTTSLYSPFNEKLLVTKRDAVVKALKLGPEMAQLSKRYLEDLTTVYILRLGWPISLYLSPVVAISKAMNEALVEGTERADSSLNGKNTQVQRGDIEQMSPVHSIAVSLMLVQVSKKISELFNVRLPESEEKKILLKAISLVTKIDADIIQSKLGVLSRNKIAQANLAKIGLHAAMTVSKANDADVGDDNTYRSSTGRTFPENSLAGSKRFRSEI